MNPGLAKWPPNIITDTLADFSGKFPEGNVAVRFPIKPESLMRLNTHNSYSGERPSFHKQIKENINIVIFSYDWRSRNFLQSVFLCLLSDSVLITTLYSAKGRLYPHLGVKETDSENLPCRSEPGTQFAPDSQIQCLSHPASETNLPDSR